MSGGKDKHGGSTKEKIFYAALELFGGRSYDSVSMRDIADAVGINCSSIYNHYKSKEEILTSLYDFYYEHWKKAAPDMDELMVLAETEPPIDVLMKLDFRFEPEYQQILNRILTIVVREINSEQSQRFMREKMAGGLMFIRPLVERMAELGRIEELDIDVFMGIVTNYTLSAALLEGTPFRMSLEKWRAGLAMVFSLIKTK